MTESNAEMFQTIVEIPLNGITVESPGKNTEKRKNVSEIQDNLLK